MRKNVLLHTLIVVLLIGCVNDPLQEPHKGVGSPAGIIKMAGDIQSGLHGVTLPESLVVKIIDFNGNGVFNVPVSFEIIEGGGNISPDSTLTDEMGFSKAEWTLGDSIQNAIVEVNVDGLDPVFFKANIQSPIDEWLEENPRIANSINWQKPSEVLSYSNWSHKQRADLYAAYELVKNKNTLVVDPPKNLFNDYLHGDDYPRTIISKEDAWQLYLEYIANSLWLEKKNRLGWSIQSYSDEDLSILFDSREYFEYRTDFAISGYSIIGRVIPAPVVYTFNFLYENGILVSDRIETIGRLLDWSHVHLTHYFYCFNTKNVYDHWQYKGIVPASRIIEGTINPNFPYYGQTHWTAGCHGTNYFYNVILRAINIPVQYVTAALHATPYFSADNLYLSHGDDPYSWLLATKPPINKEELLITKEKWHSWFGSSITEDERLNNIGRQTEELAIKYLTTYLLNVRCSDIREKRSKIESEVFEIFSRIYSLNELEEIDLWNKMDEKIDNFGGCESLPRAEKLPYY